MGGEPISPFGTPPRTSIGNGTQNDILLPAAQLWQTLNPTPATLHLRIESPVVVTIRARADNDNLLDNEPQKRRPLPWRTFYLIRWIMMIMVLPIGATTLALWGLTLYLLKNSELLDARRNKSDSPNSPEDDSGLEKIAFSTLPRVFESDVDLIAGSKNGKIIMSVGLRNEVVIWKIATNSTAPAAHISIDATDLLLSGASGSASKAAVTCVAVDDKGKYCAAGTGSGVIGIWAIHSDGVQPFPLMSVPASSAGVTQLQFIPSSATAKPSIPTSTPAQSRVSSPTVPSYLLASYENGVMAKWSVQESALVTFVTPSFNRRVQVLKASLILVQKESRLIAAFSFEDGTVELQEVDDGPKMISQEDVLQAGNPNDTVARISVCYSTINETMRVIIGTATAAGVISLWDGQTGNIIKILDDVYGPINQLCLSPIQNGTCRYCGHPHVDSFALTFSVEQVVCFFKAYLADEGRRCTCTATRPRQAGGRDPMSSLGRRSRANSSSVASIGTSSPAALRARLTSASEDIPLFPISGHGVHSRRASEKERSRLSDGFLSVTTFLDDDSSHLYGPSSDMKTTSSAHSPWSVVRLADTTCERGGWSVCNEKIVGVRRRSRAAPGQNGHALSASALTSQGLSPASLHRWEIWTFDPFTSSLHTAPLSSLTEKDRAGSEDSKTSSSPSSPKSNPVPRLPFTRVSPFIITRTRGLAGFGNTLGIFNFLS
jgi:hypothetical protein